MVRALEVDLPESFYRTALHLRCPVFLCYHGSVFLKDKARHFVSRVRMKRIIFFHLFSLAFFLSSCTTPVVEATETIQENDYFVYLVDWRLFFFEMENERKLQIIPDGFVSEFSLSSDNRLAISVSNNGKSKISILDYPFTDPTPIDIPLDPLSENTQLSWSPDGKYLVFDSVNKTTKKLLVWDGENVVSLIYYFDASVGEFAWSPDNDLAFTDFTSSGDSEVYIWDGLKVSSVSQNKSGIDRFPVWSQDGRLAFLSERDDEYDIFIWDGVSKESGVPDVKTFTNIAPDLTDYYSEPVWIDSNSLVFGGSDVWNMHIQIYEWDGQTAANISQNPFSHNGGQTWDKNGHWAFVTFFSSSQDLFIRDKFNRTILKTKGQYTPAWGQSGRLLFCVPGDSHWTLSMWDGKNTVDITHGGFIEAKWNNGAGVFCSNG